MKIPLEKAKKAVEKIDCTFPNQVIGFHNEREKALIIELVDKVKNYAIDSIEDDICEHTIHKSGDTIDLTFLLESVITDTIDFTYDLIESRIKADNKHTAKIEKIKDVIEKFCDKLEDQILYTADENSMSMMKKSRKPHATPENRS